MLLPKVDDATRREFLVGAAGLLLLPAACGGNEEQGDSSGETRTVRHAAGATEVPASPRRAVVLDNMVLDNMLALGEKPLAYATNDVYRNDGFAAYLGDRVEGIEPIRGEQYQPDLEAIAAKEPDLIVGSIGPHEEIYDMLSEVAPTVLLEAGQEDWKGDLRLVGRMLGRGERAEELLRGYERRVQQLRDRLGDPGAVEVSLAYPTPQELRIYLPRSYAGQVLGDVGLSRPPAQRELVPETAFHVWVGLSPERLPVADGDVILLMTFGSAEDEASISAVQSNPLWGRLGAVRRGAVHEVDAEYWIGGRGITASNLILDDLERHLR